MKVPKMRFKEFYNEAFGEAILNDLVEVVDCQHNTAPTTNRDTKFKMIRTSNVRNGRLIVNTMDSVEESVYNQWSSRGYLETSDIILTREAPMGEVAMIPPNKKEKFFLGQRCLQLKAKESTISPEYMFFLLQSPTFENHIRPLKSSGSTVSNIRIPELKKFNFYIPSKLEQNKVADFLIKVNKRIDLHQEKVELLKVQKKGLMQNIFNQELSFKDENNQHYPKWQDVTLGEISVIEKGTQINKAKLEQKLWDGAYPVYNGGVNTSGYHTSYNREPNSIIISEGGNSCGYVNFVKEHFWSGGHCYTITPKKNSLDIQYLYQLLKKNEKKIMLLRVGSGLPNIQKSALQKYKLFISSSPQEQKKIADLFSTFDDKIEKEEKKLSTLRAQKQAFMQQLFV